MSESECGVKSVIQVSCRKCVVKCLMLGVSSLKQKNRRKAQLKKAAARSRSSDIDDSIRQRCSGSQCPSIVKPNPHPSLRDTLLTARANIRSGPRRGSVRGGMEWNRKGFCGVIGLHVGLLSSAILEAFLTSAKSHRIYSRKQQKAGREMSPTG